MLVYTFSFPGLAAGQAVTVRDDGDVVVSTGTLPSVPTASGEVIYEASLAEGTYVASADIGNLTVENQGYLNIPESVSSGATDAPILTSPDDTAYRLVVANDGTLSTEAV